MIITRHAALQVRCVYGYIGYAYYGFARPCLVLMYLRDSSNATHSCRNCASASRLAVLRTTHSDPEKQFPEFAPHSSAIDSMSVLQRQ
jgi:hypothetical protein